MKFDFYDKSEYTAEVFYATDEDGSYDEDGQLDTANQVLIGTADFTLPQLIHTLNNTLRMKLKNSKVKDKADHGFISIQCLHMPKGVGMVSCNFQIECKMISSMANSDPGEEHFIVLSKKNRNQEIFESRKASKKGKEPKKQKASEGKYTPIIMTELKRATNSTTITWNRIFSNSDVMADSDLDTRLRMVLYANNRKRNMHIELGEANFKFGDLKERNEKTGTKNISAQESNQ